MLNKEWEKVFKILLYSPHYRLERKVSPYAFSDGGPI